MKLAALLLLVLLSGCIVEDLRMRGVPEGSSSWRFGYADGCQSGLGDAGSQNKQLGKDTKRFRADDDYRKGWEQGYHECMERELNRPTATAELEETPLPTPTETPREEPTRPQPAATVTRPDSDRRGEIEERLRKLRDETKSLESELETLPK